MNFDIKEQVAYTVELTEREAILIGLALDFMHHEARFKREDDEVALAELSSDWDEMIGMDGDYGIYGAGAPE